MAKRPAKKLYIRFKSSAILTGRPENSQYCGLFPYVRYRKSIRMVCLPLVWVGLQSAVTSVLKFSIQVKLKT